MKQKLSRHVPDENSFKKFKLKGHFCCGVIVPKTTENIEYATVGLLIPFFHPEDRGYEDGEIAKYDVIDFARNYCKIWELKKPTAVCFFCNASLRRESHKCPKMQIIWGHIGGIYNGLIRDQFIGQINKQINYTHADNRQLEDNITTVDEHLKCGAWCSAYVTPDGSWHQLGGDGKGFLTEYSGCFTTWKAEILEQLKQYHDHYIIAYHCYEKWEESDASKEFSKRL